MKFFKKKRIELGRGHIIQYTLFEWKRLGSIILYNWKTIEQNRFHSHAFPAVAFLLKGAYLEEVWNRWRPRKKVVDQWMKPRYLPRNYTHRILEAKPGTWTLVITGPWQKYWYEFFQDTKTWVKYTWGRKVVEKITNDIPPEELRSYRGN